VRRIPEPSAVATRRVEPNSRKSPAPCGDTLERAGFERGVRRWKSAIRAGEAYQVVLAHRREFRRPSDLLRRAGLLRRRERHAFFYYLKLGERELLGASPESVVETFGLRAFISPIAGTRPTGTGASRRPSLRRDPKELSEHRMLVDLARNDLGRVARAGTVRLVAREGVERFARLEHLVSRVEGTLPAAVAPARLLGAAFPAGTVTGAPKIRASQLLREVERTWRGPYGGAVGLVRAGSQASWALAIRSAFTVRERLFTAAGAGVVVGSRPGREFDETRTKLREVESTLVGEFHR
jgi:anthranilate synthase component 1